MTITSYGETHEVNVFSSHYTANNNYAVVIRTTIGEPYAVLTVNLDEVLPAGYAFVDTNNCPWAEEFITKYQLGEPVGRAKQSGFCVYPLYRFNTDKIEEHRV